MRLKTKIQLLIFLTVIFITTSLVIYVGYHLKYNLIHSREKTCSLLIKSLEKEIIYAAIINNKDVAKAIVENYLKLNFIQKIEIKKNNRIFFMLARESLPISLKIFRVSRKIENINKFKTKKIEISVYYSTEDFDVSFKKFIKNLLFILLIVLILIYFITNYITSRFLSPVDYLLENINKTAEGSFETISVKPGKDFKKVFKSYNKLITTLFAKEREIKKKMYVIEQNNKELKKRILEIQLLQEVIIRQEKLATLGIISAGIAHEINNPTGAIRGLSELALFSKNRGKYEEYFGKIISHCDRIKRIVGSIKNYNKELKKDEIEYVSLKEIINDVLELSYHAKILTNNIKITGNFNNIDIYLNCCKSQMMQVFQNLINNSVDAMKGEGEININITTDNHLIIILFSDTGKGVPPHVRKNIFDPFFSTKGTKGTGLGLYITHKIIKNHKGNIELLDSNKGALFKITLIEESNIPR